MKLADLDGSAKMRLPQTTSGMSEQTGVAEARGTIAALSTTLPISST
jgi:hypothetical protein